jgi:hypothetical protein
MNNLTFTIDLSTVDAATIERINVEIRSYRSDLGFFSPTDNAYRYALQRQHKTRTEVESMFPGAGWLAMRKAFKGL